MITSLAKISEIENVSPAKYKYRKDKSSVDYHFYVYGTVVVAAIADAIELKASKIIKHAINA